MSYSLNKVQSTIEKSTEINLYFLTLCAIFYIDSYLFIMKKTNIYSYILKIDFDVHIGKLLLLVVGFSFLLIIILPFVRNVIQSFASTFLCGKKYSKDDNKYLLGDYATVNDGVKLPTYEVEKYAMLFKDEFYLGLIEKKEIEKKQFEKSLNLGFSVAAIFICNIFINKLYSDGSIKTIGDIMFEYNVITQLIAILHIAGLLAYSLWCHDEIKILVPGFYKKCEGKRNDGNFCGNNIKKYDFKSVPELKDLEYECSKCGTKYKVKIRGSSFS